MDDGNLKKAILQFPSKRVAVFGDIMLDKYTLGDVSRISPEAPVPVLRKTSERFVLGGAGNVVANVVALGAKAHLFGVRGNDSAGEVVADLLQKQGADSSGVLVHARKPTTLKHRIVSGASHQLLRVDEEDTSNLDAAEEDEIIDRFSKVAPDVDAIILSDYAKGVFSARLARAVFDLASKLKKPALADFKPRNKAMFVGANLISPNLKEGREMTGLEAVEEVGPALVKYFGADVMLTRGGDGVSVFKKGDGSHHHVPGKKIKVYDVSGAGDTSIATTALALASGLGLESAALVANSAGAVVVQKPGTATVSLEELLSELRAGNHIESVNVVPKVWGYEKWLENNDRYCSKLLSLNKGFQCSLHYHKVKDETFLVTKGHVRLELGDQVMHLREGNFVRIPPGTKHRFAGVEDSLILEVSTHHDEADSYRLEESGPVRMS